MPPVAAWAFGLDLAGSSVGVSRHFWISMFMVFTIAPFVVRRSLKALQSASVMALLAVSYMMVLVLVYSKPDDGPGSPDGPLLLWRWSASVFRAFPIILFAFACHQNIISIYDEMKDRGSSVAVVRRAVSLTLMSYLLVRSAAAGTVVLSMNTITACAVVSDRLACSAMRLSGRTWRTTSC